MLVYVCVCVCVSADVLRSILNIWDCLAGKELSQVRRNRIRRYWVRTSQAQIVVCKEDPGQAVRESMCCELRVGMYGKEN